MNEGKRAALAAVIGRLHAGESVAAVKRDFDVLVKDVSAEEIAALEQSLMAAGMPAEEIQRLCEVHVAVFEKSLEKHGRPDKVAGHPVHTYMAENAAGRLSLRRLKAAAGRLRFGWTRDPNALAAFDAAEVDFRKILVHYARKENQLFPYLEAKGFDAPSKVMWGKHDEVRAAFRDLAAARAVADWPAVRRAVGAIAARTAKLMFMEERILFPAALDKLGEADWIAARRGEAAIGYAWVTPGGAWDPDIAEMKAGAPAAAAAAAAAPIGAPAAASPVPAADVPAPSEVPGALRLGEGWLTLEQIDLMLKSLPVDVSFVDEHDRVLYYSDGAERIFPRSPGAIGRNVANCHPPKSLPTVRRILAAFRAKEKSTAEFWIELFGKFIHIRYFALYDRRGTYRGTLEVSQDATGIRALSGQRRLLDWE
jgi:DUF438 domain-containing protein